jgi:hypothetical protein
MTDHYIPGTCNIGPEEIALRRRAGHVGLAVTAALGATLVRSNLHPVWRLALALPAAGAASGYLQARQHFCANYGFRGLYNFDTRGHEQPVPLPNAQEQDRRRSIQLATASAAIGLGVALVAMTIRPRRPPRA